MPWTPYKVGKKSDSPKWTNPDCEILNKIGHVVHLETAGRILKDGKIKSNIVSPSSSLEIENVSVAWFSPNSWSDGSRYGNIEFVFDFSKLIEGKNIYWAGVKNYGVNACCFFITKRKLGKEYKKYDPLTDKGPWKYSLEEEEHYWNGKVALEFMFESDISLENCKGLNFVMHHRNFCSIDASKCQDKSVDIFEAGKRFIANVIANDLPVEYHFFGKSRGSAKGNLTRVFKQFLRFTVDFDFIGSIRSKDSSADTLVRAALNFYHLGEMENFETLICMFKSRTDFKDTILTLITKKFKITDIDSLYER